MVFEKDRIFCCAFLPFPEKVVDKNVSNSYNIQALARVLEW